MAKLDARRANESFDMTVDATVTFASLFSSSSTSYACNTTGGDRLFFTGTGISVNSSGRPAGGTVNRAKIDLGRDGSLPSNDIDIDISGLSASLRTMMSRSSEFWKSALSGDDVIYAPSHAGAIMFGDADLFSSPRDVTGGRDTIVGGISIRQVLIGDAYQIARGNYTGGNDTVIGSKAGGTLVGDAYVASRTHMTGGIDRLTGSDTARDVIIGDIVTVEDGWTIFGGNDIINARGGNDSIIGDVRNIANPSLAFAPTVNCGNDLAHGGAGNDEVIGDFGYGEDTIYSNVVNCGNDRLYGDAGNDTIYGDTKDSTFFAFGGMRFGDDTLYGGAGDDVIYGDAAAIYSGAPDQGGDDLIDGGAGNDRLYSNGGVDSFRFLFGADNDQVVDFEDDTDQLLIDDAYGFADAAQVVAATSADGDDAVIDLGGGDSIRLVAFLATNTIADLHNDITII
jgi:Ca2+-binding RTX toxin-like protein